MYDFESKKLKHAKNLESMVHSQKKLTQTNPKEVQIIYLLVKDFKLTVLNILTEYIEKKKHGQEAKGDQCIKKQIITLKRQKLFF